MRGWRLGRGRLSFGRHPRLFQRGNYRKKNKHDQPDLKASPCGIGALEGQGVCTCVSMCTCLWAPLGLPSQNKGCSVERCHKPGWGGQGLGQSGRAEAGARACSMRSGKGQVSEQGSAAKAC